MDRKRLWEEKVVSNKLGEYVGSRDLVSIGSLVCKKWRFDIGSNESLWHSFATSDFKMGSGPFGLYDEKQFGEVLGRRMSHFAFLPPYNNDPEIWQPGNQWQLQSCRSSNNNRFCRIFEMYQDFFDKWFLVDQGEQSVRQEAHDLQTLAVDQWKQWQNLGRPIYRFFLYFMMMLQTILLPLALDSKYQFHYEKVGNPAYLVASNELVAKPSPCDDWKRCWSWSKLLFPFWILFATTFVAVLWTMKPYLKKKLLRRRYKPMFQSHPTLIPLRKITVAEFPQDAPKATPPPPRPRPPPPLPTILTTTTTVPAPVPRRRRRRVNGYPRGGALLGYRLLCKLICGELCLMSILMFALWVDELITWPAWTCTLWLHPCPLVMGGILPRKQWKRRWCPLGTIAIMWWTMSVLAALQLSGTMNYSGFWLFSIIGMPLVVALGILADPVCDLTTRPHNRQQNNNNNNNNNDDSSWKEAFVVVLSIVAVAAFWAAGLMISGRIDAYMRFSWLVAAAPLWITFTTLTIADALDTNHSIDL